jgi:hypothetical protein
MGKIMITTTCFLCAAPATCTDTDAGNRKFYQCSNAACGDYEISVTVMRRMENSPNHKQQAMHEAHGLRNNDKFLELIVGSDNQIVGSAVQRGTSSK